MTHTPSRRRFFRNTAATSIGVLAGGRASATGHAQSIVPAGGAYIADRKVLLWESTRKEFREAVER